MSTKPKDDNAIMMDGTTTLGSYRVIAINGNVALGLKIYGVYSGSEVNAPEYTYIAYYLRSALKPKSAKKTEGNTEELPVKQDLVKAWPNLSFEKQPELGSNRASGRYGMFVKAKYSFPKELYEAIITENPVDMIAYQLFKDVGDNMIMTERQLAEYMAEQIKPFMESLKINADLQDEISEDLADKMSVPGTHNASVQSLVQKKVGKTKKSKKSKKDSTAAVEDEMFSSDDNVVSPNFGGKKDPNDIAG